MDRKLRPRLAWIRNTTDVSDEEIRLAAGRFRAVILQPWEFETAARLREADPRVTVLAYQCLSSVRLFETGDRVSSGISLAQSLQLDSSLPGGEWTAYPGHVQQRVWAPAYQEAWADSVASKFAGTPFSGIMADNDVFDDYYHLGLDMDQVREGLDKLVTTAGRTLRKHKLSLVPNIAESRREPGRWRRHSRFGGGLEECWLGWGTEDNQWLGFLEIAGQMRELNSPGLVIARVPGTGEERDPSLLLALACAWVFLPGRDVAVTATAPDGFDALPLLPEADLDLGRPKGPVIVDEHTPGIFHRVFSEGLAAVNVGPKAGLVSTQAGTFLLEPRTGMLLSRP